MLRKKKGDLRMKRIFCLLTVLAILMVCPAALPPPSYWDPNASETEEEAPKEEAAEDLSIPAQSAPITLHTAYAKGKGGARFAPREVLTRAEAASLLAGLFSGGTDSTAAADYPDLPRDAWYTGPISWMCARGAMEGYGDGTIRPESPITRAEFVTLMCAFFQAEPSAQRFSDVPSGHWAASAISAAAGQGWVRGCGGGLFHPDRNITRAEAVTALNAALGRSPNTLTSTQLRNRPFIDVRPDDWFYGAVLEATVNHTFAYGSGQTVWTGSVYRPCGYPRGVQRIGGAFYLVNNDLQIHFLQPGLQTVNGKLYFAAGDGSIPVCPDGVTIEGVAYSQQADGSLVPSSLPST